MFETTNQIMYLIPIALYVGYHGFQEAVSSIIIHYLPTPPHCSGPLAGIFFFPVGHVVLKAWSWATPFACFRENHRFRRFGGRWKIHIG